MRLDFPKPFPTSRRGRRVASVFGLPTRSESSPAPQPPDSPAAHIPRGGRIMLITGPSGSGKSLILRQIQKQAGRRGISLDQIILPRCPVVDCFPGLSFRNTLRLLAQVGLGEAWTFLRRPGELSDGQAWRLRLAMAIHQSTRLRNIRRPVLLCDEFAALLDRITAMVISHLLRKIVASQPNLCAVVATSHDDLADSLGPDEILECDFGLIRSRKPRLKSLNGINHENA